jgi:IS30 family transposase
MGKCYEQLSLSERVYVQSQLELGFKAAAIAAALRREPSTISRELRRNGWKRPPPSHARAEGRPLPPQGYRADRAHQRAEEKAALLDAARGRRIFVFTTSTMLSQAAVSQNADCKRAIHARLPGCGKVRM